MNEANCIYCKNDLLELYSDGIGELSWHCEVCNYMITNDIVWFTYDKYHHIFIDYKNNFSIIWSDDYSYCVKTPQILHITPSNISDKLKITLSFL